MPGGCPHEPHSKQGIDAAEPRASRKAWPRRRPAPSSTHARGPHLLHRGCKLCSVDGVRGAVQLHERPRHARQPLVLLRHGCRATAAAAAKWLASGSGRRRQVAAAAAAATARNPAGWLNFGWLQGRGSRSERRHRGGGRPLGTAGRLERRPAGSPAADAAARSLFRNRQPATGCAHSRSRGLARLDLTAAQGGAWGPERKKVLTHESRLQVSRDQALARRTASTQRGRACTAEAGRPCPLDLLSAMTATCDHKCFNLIDSHGSSQRAVLYCRFKNAGAGSAGAAVHKETLK